MKILGIHDGHNAAACLFEGGQVAAVVQEERLRCVKNSAVYSGENRVVTAAPLPLLMLPSGVYTATNLGHWAARGAQDFGVSTGRERREQSV